MNKRLTDWQDCERVNNHMLGNGDYFQHVQHGSSIRWWLADPNTSPKFACVQIWHAQHGTGGFKRCWMEKKHIHQYSRSSIKRQKCQLTIPRTKQYSRADSVAPDQAGSVCTSWSKVTLLAYGLRPYFTSMMCGTQLLSSSETWMGDSYNTSRSVID